MALNAHGAAGGEGCGISLRNIEQTIEQSTVCPPQLLVLRETRKFADPPLRRRIFKNAQKTGAQGTWQMVGDEWFENNAAVAAPRECAFSRFISTESPTPSTEPKAESSNIVAGPHKRFLRTSFAFTNRVTKANVSPRYGRSAAISSLPHPRHSLLHRTAVVPVRDAS